MIAKLPRLESSSAARPDDLKKGIDLLEQSASITRATLAQLTEVERQLGNSIRVMTKVYETVLVGAGDARINGKAKLSAGSELMSPDEVARELKISRGTLWRMRTDGRLPQPVRVSLRKLAYRRSEIVAWLETGGAKT